jgi:ankyrin repeat protein
VAQCLVTELGADVNSGNDESCTPLYTAAQKGHLAFSAEILDQISHETFVRYLVKYLGANVNRKTKSGFTPLHTVAQMGYLDVVRCMVDELGADVNEATEDATTPLMYAAKYLNRTIVRYLLRRGANPPTCTGIAT